MKKIPTVTHQQKKINIVNGKPIFYEDDRLSEARSKFMSLLYPHVPDEIFKGPVSCVVKWLFPSKSVKETKWKDTRPDTHNMNKLLFDVMTDLGFWEDDAQVAQEIIEKFWINPKMENSGLYIYICNLE